MPYLKGKFKSINFFDLKVNNDKLNKKKQFGNEIISKSEYKKSKAMDIFINYNYKKAKKDYDNFSKIESIGEENDDSNNSILAEINSNIVYI